MKFMLADLVISLLEIIEKKFMKKNYKKIGLILLSGFVLCFLIYEYQKLKRAKDCEVFELNMSFNLKYFCK